MDVQGCLVEWGDRSGSGEAEGSLPSRTPLLGGSPAPWTGRTTAPYHPPRQVSSRMWAAAQANLPHPVHIGPYDDLHLRQSASLYGKAPAAEVEALGVGLEARYQFGNIERALTEPLASVGPSPPSTCDL